VGIWAVTAVTRAVPVGQDTHRPARSQQGTDGASPAACACVGAQAKNPYSVAS
jgi:hypothetical protein